MPSAPTEGPKTFISYSWSSPDHQAWVINLATQLMDSGVEVVLDKWDLREGDDKYVFMEKMVTDPAVRKVVMICDRIYKEKADGREGGVGTETQIISGELYNQVDQQKFVAVTTDRDSNGKPYLPAYLKSRIYIDMSDSNESTDSFEQLLRWIYDQPLHRKPDKGKPPSYLFDQAGASLATTTRFQRAVEAVKNGKTTAAGALEDYFGTFTTNMENFRVTPQDDKEFDDQVIENIESFLPYRNEAVEVLLNLARYQPTQGSWDAIHRFVERLLPYRFQPAKENSWGNWQADNFRFLTHELFLYSIAALLKYERFEGVRQLIERDYFMPKGSPEIESGMIPFTTFRHILRSLEQRNKRLELRRLSLTADLLQKRANIPELGFEDLMQADFVLFLHADLRPTDGRWMPETLLYADRHPAFEIFARAQSSAYFMNLRTALGITQKKELEELNQRYVSKELKIPRWEWETFNPARLMGIDRLASKP